MNKKSITALAVIAVLLLAVVVGVFVTMDSNDMGETLGSGGQTEGGNNGNSIAGGNGTENETGNSGDNGAGGAESNTNNSETTAVEPLSDVIKVSGYDWDYSAATTVINLGNGTVGGGVTVSGDGAKISGSDIVIENGGQYELTGTLADGRIVIDAKKENVYIKLNNANISCSYSSAIYGYKADKLVLVLGDGSENSITDASDYNYSDDYSTEEDTVPNACIYAKMDLLICGSGKLNVTGNCEQGISGKDNLDIADANINVVSVGKAILGKERIAVSNAVIEAESVDDALHSNGNVLLDGGKYMLTSEDDAIHADAGVVTDGADITIKGSEEGIEGWQVYLLNSEITVNSNDDGINATDGSSDGMGFGGFGGGHGGGQGGFDGQGGHGGGFGGHTPPELGNGQIPDFSDEWVPGMGARQIDPDQSVSSTEIKIVIKNSNIYINAGGDGIDSNGSIYMDGGTVIVYGPSNSGNGGLDYDITFELVSGTLLVVDVTGMTMVPSTCELSGIDVTLTQNLSAGDVVCVSTSGYSYCFEIIKNSNHFTLITPEMKTGDNVLVYTGGSYSGSFDGYLVNGDGYNGGSEAAALTLESGITSYGSRGGFGRF